MISTLKTLVAVLTLSAIWVLLLNALPVDAATTITKVVVRDCDKQADTSMVVTSGQTIDPASLPAHYTLDFVTAKSAAMYFVTDGGAKIEYEASPYCPIGHNTPLAWKLGQHTVSVQIDGSGVEPMIYSFTIASPAVQVATQIEPSFGSNLAGISGLSGDPSAHPALLSTAKALNLQYIRLWTEGTIGNKFASNYWSTCQHWHAAGFKVVVVLNYQNSKVRCEAPADADWITSLQSIPPPATSGVWGVCLGNETDTATYYIGSDAQLAHLCQLAYPILHAAGFYVIGPSTVDSLTQQQSLFSLGASKWYDAIDYHYYTGSAAGCLQRVDQATAEATIEGKALFCTEGGDRGNSKTPADLATWGVQQQALFTGLQSRSGVFLQFPLYVGTNATDPLSQMAPLTINYLTNEPFASAMAAALANK